jgi:hypothetical protein
LFSDGEVRRNEPLEQTVPFFAVALRMNAMKRLLFGNELQLSPQRISTDHGKSILFVAITIEQSSTHWCNDNL